jgi:hypothetical protein
VTWLFREWNQVIFYVAVFSPVFARFSASARLLQSNLQSAISAGALTNICSKVPADKRLFVLICAIRIADIVHAENRQNVHITLEIIAQKRLISQQLCPASYGIVYQLY